METNQAQQLVCSWSEFWGYCETVAQAIMERNQDYTQAIAIIRGGYYLGDYLSRRLHLPLGVIVAKSYSDDNAQETLTMGEFSWVQKPCGKILLVDDLVDSGITMETIKHKLIKEHRVEVDTAVIWQKSHARFKPDYYHSVTPADFWIVQPFENES
ncbi:phosphoribosyltransferase [Cyanobacterium stanieri LEGE 03274]|uniref:Phosphoribosyltransferase n=1 Tax=Cyanobacterium stanieri LEGE 03274 TaxID=1828756 RepID=A0ABR9V5M8_9CHRO|nr:phosphoribosyltransferase family protein [Cyanobacterium stanieri]MBE9223196.1 phosphoribosyltransferase [Cyanobacterium stanieri LEGE 03274]